MEFFGAVVDALESGYHNPYAEIPMDLTRTIVMGDSGAGERLLSERIAERPDAPLRVAAFQRRPLFDDVDQTIQRLKDDLRWCDEHRVDLAVFPECFLQGYSSNQQTLARRAFSLNSASMTRILLELAALHVTCILGLVERREANLYNSAAVIRGGKLLGTYSKSYPNEDAFKAGTAFPTFEVLDWRFGINICNDANFIEPAGRLRDRGATLLCYPLNNMLKPETANRWRNKSLENLQQRAIDTNCWVVSSDVVGQHEQKISYGCTCIVRPDGTLMEQVSEGSEGVIVADIT